MKALETFQRLLKPLEMGLKKHTKDYKTLRNLQKSLKSFEDFWRHLNTLEGSWKHLKAFDGSRMLLKSLEVLRRFLKAIQEFWRYLEAFKSFWQLINSFEAILMLLFRKALEVFQNLLMAVDWSLLKSLVIYEKFWSLGGFQRLLKVFKDLWRILRAHILGIFKNLQAVWRLLNLFNLSEVQVSQRIIQGSDGSWRPLNTLEVIQRLSMNFKGSRRFLEKAWCSG